MNHYWFSKWNCSILMLTLVLASCSSYNIISTNSKGDFIEPPASKLNLDKKGNAKHRYRYALIQGLSSNYQSSVKNIGKTIVWSGKKDYLNDKKSFLKIHRVTKFNDKYPFEAITTNEKSKRFKTGKFGDHGYFIQFDYSDLLSGTTPGDVAEDFNSLGIELLLDISSKEGAGNGHLNWPTSISQNIVEKIWEQIPIPQVASLARYGFLQTPLYSVFLLNPKFKLEHDGISQGASPIDVSGRIKLTSWNATNGTRFYRDNTNASIKQVPYLGLDKSKYPDNKIGTINHTDISNNSIAVSYFNIAGTADLELSAKITNSKYIALYQPPQRSNILNAKLNDDDLSNCCVTPYDCNSQIVLSDDVKSIFSPPNICFGGIPIYKEVATCGIRNFIEALLKIKIDGDDKGVPLGQTSQILTDQGEISAIRTIRRLYNGKHRKIRFSKNTTDIILLPLDIIKTK